MKLPIYLDYNATTPVDARVMARMVPYFTEHFGNASSKAHAYGWAADEAVAEAREAVAAMLGAMPEEIVFTAGATEALNTALKGVAEVYAPKGRHLITVETEHKAVRDTCQRLERDGFRVTYLPVDAAGQIALKDLDAALTEDTILVAVMWANNEVGTVHPIAEIGARVRAHGALMLCDATQAVGKIPVEVANVDLLACSAHKFYGPKGIGALYIRRRTPRVRLVPLLDGGGQEAGRRGGTLNVPGIVGMGAAAEIVQAERAGEARRLEALRDRLEAKLVAALPGMRVNAQDAPRLPQTTNITFPGLRAAPLMTELRDLAVSAGSACSSGTGQPSHVLTALGLAPDDARATLRLSLGRFTTAEEIDHAARRLVEACTGEAEKGRSFVTREA